MSNPTPHQLVKLDRERPTVRLLKISKLQDGTIDCRFLSSRLDDAPRYVALSYTWGPPSPVREIILEGRKFFIRENLWQALSSPLRRPKQGLGEMEMYSNSDLVTAYRDLHSNKESRRGKSEALYWIDALCIDQQDLQERNHQITLMGKIYSSAIEVLIWLGPHSDDSHRAMATLRSPESTRTSEETDALVALFSRPYWTRMWIVPELILARSLCALCGDELLSYEQLMGVLIWWAGASDHSSQRSVMEEINATPAYNILSVKQIWHDERLRINEVHHALTRWLGQECTDPKDMIYALLGICKSQLIPDYSKSLEEVFCDLLREPAPQDDLEEKVAFKTNDDLQTKVAVKAVHTQVIMFKLDVDPYHPIVIAGLRQWLGDAKFARYERAGLWRTGPIEIISPYDEENSL